MRKRKWLAVGLAAVMALCTMVGCSIGGGGGDKVEQADPNKKAEIEFYVWSEQALCQEIADGFHEIYPNWTVKVTLSTSDYYQSLQTYSGADIMPDVFYMQPGYISDFCRDELLLNLSPYIARGEDFTEDDLWDLNVGYRYDTKTEKLGTGDLYAFVKDFTPEFAMVYNKSHIDEYDASHDVPLAAEVGYPTDADGKYPSSTLSMSWAQNEKMCHLLTQFNAVGNITRYGSNLSFEPWAQLGQYAAQLGSSLFDEGGYFKAEDQNVIRAVNHLKNYMDGDNVSSVKIGSSTVNDGMGFTNGNISVLFTGRWAYTQYDWANLAEFDIGLAPPPMPEAEQDVKSVSAMVGIAASSASKNPGVAYKFIEYYMTVGQRMLSKRGFNIPGNKTIAQNDYVDTGDETVDAVNRWFVSLVDKCEMVEVNPYLDYGSWATQFGMEIAKCWASSNDRLSVEDALKAAKSSVDAKVDQNKRRYGI